LQAIGDYAPPPDKTLIGVLARSGAKEENKQTKKGASHLSASEKKELTKLPTEIEKLEADQQRVFLKLGDPYFYEGTSQEINKVEGEARSIKEALEKAYHRWEELEKPPL